MKEIPVSLCLLKHFSQQLSHGITPSAHNRWTDKENLVHMQWNMSEPFMGADDTGLGALVCSTRQGDPQAWGSPTGELLHGAEIPQRPRGLRLGNPAPLPACLGVALGVKEQSGALGLSVFPLGFWISLGTVISFFLPISFGMEMSVLCLSSYYILEMDDLFDFAGHSCNKFAIGWIVPQSSLASHLDETPGFQLFELVLE